LPQDAAQVFLWYETLKQKKLNILKRKLQIAKLQPNNGVWVLLVFACGANYPHQALNGGYFLFVWRVGT
jgi:hypothetical protein